MKYNVNINECIKKTEPHGSLQGELKKGTYRTLPKITNPYK